MSEPEPARYARFWICSGCSSRNGGGDLKCLGCPRSRTEDDVMEDDPNAVAITDPGLLKKAASGPTKYCCHCASEADDDTTRCPNCGSSQFQAARPHVEREPEPEQPAPLRVRGGPNWFLIGGLGMLLVGLLTTCIWLFFVTETINGTVTDTRWDRTIEVERLGDRKEGWSQPADSKLLYTEQRDRTHSAVTMETRTRMVWKDVPTGKTKKVKTGKKVESKNRGFLEDEYKEVPETERKLVPEEYQEAVTHTWVQPDTWYVYRPWVHDRFERAGGDTDPRWPPVVLTREQRAEDNKKTETFKVTFIGEDGKTYEWPCKGSEVEFRRLSKGTTAKLKVNMAGQLVSVE